MEPLKKLKIRCVDIIAECERQFGLSNGALRTKNKMKHLAGPRHIAIYLCRKMTNRSYPQIALVVGYKDHTTALYAMKRAPILLKSPEIAKKAKAVEDAINARSNGLA